MVKGLEVFSEHFKGYTDNYIIIGELQHQYQWKNSVLHSELQKILT
jgi:hypothetical protein